MPKAKPAFYAVAKGRVPGIYATWAECEAQVKGFPGGRQKGFASADDARAYLSEHGVAAANFNAFAGPSTNVGRQHAAKPYARPATAASSGAKAHKANSLETDRIADESGWDVVYSDGSCRGNGKPGSVAGIGVWWGQNDARNLAERCPGGQTNNRAELIAIARVLETAPITKRPLLLKTDSQYSIRCFKDWIAKWIANNWKVAGGSPVKNAPLIRYIAALLDVRARAGQRVHLQYVRGHVGEEGNEGADRLANEGALMPELEERDWVALVEEVRAQNDKKESGVVLAVAISNEGDEECAGY